MWPQTSHLPLNTQMLSFTHLEPKLHAIMAIDSNNKNIVFGPSQGEGEAECETKVGSQAFLDSHSCRH